MSNPEKQWGSKIKLESNDLIKRHYPRLMELGEKAKVSSRAFADMFPNDYEGKVMFALSLAQSIAALCNVTPGLSPETFINDARNGAAIWVDCGEPKTAKDEISSPAAIKSIDADGMDAARKE